MASASGSITGYGQPPSLINPFNGQGEFDIFQHQVQQATYFSHISSMSPDAQDTLDALLEEITTLFANDAEETSKNTAKITYRENKKKDMLKEDQVLYQLLVKSVNDEQRTSRFQQKRLF